MTASTASSQPPHSEPEGHQFLSHQQIKVVMAGLMAGMFLAALDQSIVGVALPRIVSDLGGLNYLSWVVTAYLLTSTAVTPLWGKISDLYGRRIIFQAAIIIFLIGSVLCGLSQNMLQLIVFRALQGIGGGGLMAIAFAIIGDVIAPRERGRYQGYFGAVFGLSSVAGPLLGGWITDAINWRWIFYINLPIGIAALIITSMALKMPVVRRNHSIDYLGATLIVGSVSMLLLYLNWAGEQYGWGALGPLALVAGSLVLAVAFIMVELRAEEPIIPMRMFRNSIFSVGNLYGFMAGVAMFGCIIYVPLYFQAVMGMSATRSGMAMVPAVAGILSMSILSGILITRTGKYKIYPIIGAVLLMVAILLLSTISVGIPYWQMAIYIFLFGSGLGFTMQTVVTAIQNAVEFRDMGAATSSTTFLRQLGGAIGAAVFGAVLANRLGHYLLQQFGAVPGGSGEQIDANNIDAIQNLAEPEKTMVLTAYTDALQEVFLIGLPFVAIALIASFFLKEIPLQSGVLASSDEAAEPMVVSVGHD